MADEAGRGLQTGEIQEWKSGLFDCFQDPKSCAFGLLCPCVLFGQNVETLHGRSCFGPCTIHCLLGGCFAFGASWAIGPVAFWATLVSCYACGYRTEIRSKYHLPDRPMGDCATHFLCHPCAICQEYRELKARPFNPSNLNFYGGGGDIAMTAPAVTEIRQDTDAQS